MIILFRFVPLSLIMGCFQDFLAMIPHCGVIAAIEAQKLYRQLQLDPAKLTHVLTRRLLHSRV